MAPAQTLPNGLSHKEYYTSQATTSTPSVHMAPHRTGIFADDMGPTGTFSSAQRIEPQRPTGPLDIAVSSAHCHLQNMDHATSLSVESDRTFLDPVHNFLRCKCIELFVVTQIHKMFYGRGTRPSKVGQVGLRCFYCKDAPRKDLARQAVCFPSKLETIFESVRNYQRTHFEDCPHIPKEIKANYKSLLKQDGGPLKKTQKYVKAYYAEAASELGLVDTPKGLFFGAPPNRTGVPSERLGALITAAESPAKQPSFWKAYSSCKDEAIQMKKFEHVASVSTRTVIANARKYPSPFVHPQDFPAISDVDFLLFHQVSPCEPTAARLEQKGLHLEHLRQLPCLCCKHCARANEGELLHKGVYFPRNLAAFSDSSFSQSLWCHVTGCHNVPREIKNALVELKTLAATRGVRTKRGSKTMFLKKVWARIEGYYGGGQHLADKACNERY
ncbi:hypothetical protein ACHAXR_007912 [Thalassiosira sp. AJA248-18]